MGWLVVNKGHENNKRLGGMDSVHGTTYLGFVFLANKGIRVGQFPVD